MLQRIQRFNRILKLRENYRQEEQVVLAEERREEDDVLHKLDFLGKEKSGAIDTFRGGEAERTVPLQEIWLQRQTIDVIEKHIDKGRENLSDVRRRIAGTEQRLLEKHRDVRVMETYIDHLRMDADKEIQAAEQNELDDIGVVRYGRGLVDAGNMGAKRLAAKRADARMAEARSRYKSASAADKGEGI